MLVKGLRCKECGKPYLSGGAAYVCASCLGPLEVVYAKHTLTPEKLKARITKGPQTLWRYLDFLPFDSPGAGLPVGMTPLVAAPRLAECLGVREVWIKNDAANPTHSFKDRVVAIAAKRAQELDMRLLACASTGNLANAVAAQASALGMKHLVLVPSSLEVQKLAASAVYDPGLVRVRASYDAINRLCVELSAKEEGWGFVNINLRPYYAEGSKTLAFEVAEQLGWELPDRVVAPVASGSLYVKIAQGFVEWREAGLVRGTLPIMHGVQSEGCAPVAQAFTHGTDVIQPVRANTIVTSLAIGSPADGPYALRVARTSGGSIESVSDEEMRAGVRLLAQTTGIFTEAAGGVVVALTRRLAEQGRLASSERLVLYMTSSGLKTIEATVPSIEAPVIEPDVALAAFLSFLESGEFMVPKRYAIG